MNDFTTGPVATGPLYRVQARKTGKPLANSTSLGIPSTSRLDPDLAE